MATEPCHRVRAPWDDLQAAFAGKNGNSLHQSSRSSFAPKFLRGLDMGNRDGVVLAPVGRECGQPSLSISNRFCAALLRTILVCSAISDANHQLAAVLPGEHIRQRIWHPLEAFNNVDGRL